jgi:hypothetical protein
LSVIAGYFRRASTACRLATGFAGQAELTMTERITVAATHFLVLDANAWLLLSDLIGAKHLIRDRIVPNLEKEFNNQRNVFALRL